jgi:aspartate dehydrogenase
MTAAVRFGVIGYGAITHEIVRSLAADGSLSALAGVLVRPARISESDRAISRFPVVDRLDALLELGPDVVVECAGHGAMREYGPHVLARGVDLMCVSVGVLADSDFATQLARAAKNARLLIPSGAVAGIDGLLAARTAGLKRVVYTSIKPPVAWSGTAAERILDPTARKRRTTFFEGTAREAALRYPQNANVAATVGLAGLGLDCTATRLVSDPDVAAPLGIIEAEGDFGTFRFESLAYASPQNPKTSTLTAHSIVMALRQGWFFSPPPPPLKR